MARTDIRASDAGATLRRVSLSTLEIEGIVHDHPNWAGKVCGGRLLVEDFRPKGVRRDPYEIYCEICGSCYADGCQTIAEILPASREYFAR